MIAFDLTSFSSDRSGIGKLAIEYSRAFESDAKIFFYVNKRIKHLIPNIERSRKIWAPKLKFLLSIILIPAWVRMDSITKIVFFNHRTPFFLPRNISVIIFVHDLVHLKYPETMKPLTRLLDMLFFERGCRRANRIICVSRSTAFELTNEFPNIANKISVIHPLIEGPKNSDSLNYWRRNLTQRIVFLAIGSFEPRKNYRRLLSAFSLIDTVDVEWELILIGANSWGAYSIQDSIKESGLEKRVVVKENVNKDELQKIFEKSDCLIQASVYEGFGLPVLEAIRHSLPVIIANRGAPLEIVPDPVCCFDPNDIVSISKAIKKFICLSKLDVFYARKNMTLRSDQLKWSDSLKAFREIIDE